MEQRVETLVLPVEPKTVNVPKLDMNGSPWAAAAKLGRYLISGLDEQSRDDLMLAVLRVMSGTENARANRNRHRSLRPSPNGPRPRAPLPVRR